MKTAGVGPQPSRRVPSWAIVLVVGGVTGTVTSIVGDHFLEAQLPASLQGKWTVVEGEGKGSTIEFFRNGVMRRMMPLPNGFDVLEGKASVEGNNLFLKVILPRTGREATSHQLIFDLSGRQLVTGDLEGNITILRRAS